MRACGVQSDTRRESKPGRACPRADSFRPGGVLIDVGDRERGTLPTRISPRVFRELGCRSQVHSFHIGEQLAGKGVNCLPDERPCPGKGSCVGGVAISSLSGFRAQIANNVTQGIQMSMEQGRRHSGHTSPGTFLTR